AAAAAGTSLPDQSAPRRAGGYRPARSRHPIRQPAAPYRGEEANATARSEHLRSVLHGSALPPALPAPGQNRARLFQWRAPARQSRTPAASAGTSTGRARLKAASCPRSDRQERRGLPAAASLRGDPRLPTEDDARTPAARPHRPPAPRTGPD